MDRRHAAVDGEDLAGDVLAGGRAEQQRSTTMAFCEGAVYDADDHLCAHATGTFKYLRALPSSKGGLKLQRRNAASSE